MIIPKRFSIKGNEWKVKFISKLTYNREQVNGLTYRDDRLILLRRELPKKYKPWVFWHEYGHALLYESGVTQNTGGVSDLAEEIICDTFADVMIGFKTVEFVKEKKK